MGQDEVDIVRLADITVVVLVPGMGDDVQTIEAGIMEIADIFVVNKSDREGAERVEREIRALQSLSIRGDEWTPPVVKTVASQGIGLARPGFCHSRLRGVLEEGRAAGGEKAQELAGPAGRDVARCAVGKGTRAAGQRNLGGYAEEVAEHKRDPYALMEEIVGRLGKG